MKLFKIKKQQKITIIIISIIFLTIWLVCFININKRFPKAQVIDYTEGESFIDNNIEYSVIKSSIIHSYEDIVSRFTDSQVLDAMSRGQNKDYLYLYTELSVTNHGSNELNVWSLAQSFLAESYPSAWHNAPFVECDKSIIKQEEKAVMKMAFIINIPEGHDCNNEEFHLVYRTYPQKIEFVLDIDGD